MSTGITDVAELGARLTRISPQRWSMSFAALLGAAAATLATGAAAGSQSLVAIVIVVGLAGIAVARPDTHTALGVLVAAVWYWLAAVDDPSTAWAIAAASALFTFHTLVALLSTIPPGGVVDRITLRRWAVRAGLVLAATAATGATVTVLDRRALPGSAWLTMLALVTALALAAALRTRVDPTGDRPEASTSSKYSAE